MTIDGRNSSRVKDLLQECLLSSHRVDTVYTQEGNMVSRPLTLSLRHPYVIARLPPKMPTLLATASNT